MKTLLILRHANARRRSPTGEDLDRPLDERGRRDAPRIGRLIAERELVPDLVLASPAKRAAATARLAAEAGGFEDRIRFSDELYGAGADDCLALLRRVGPSERRVLVVGHNPTLEELVGLLTDRDARLPTGGLVRIDVELEEWRHLARGAGRLARSWRPQELA